MMMMGARLEGGLLQGVEIVGLGDEAIDRVAGEAFPARVVQGRGTRSTEESVIVASMLLQEDTSLASASGLVREVVDSLGDDFVGEGLADEESDLHGIRIEFFEEVAGPVALGDVAHDCIDDDLDAGSVQVLAADRHTDGLKELEEFVCGGWDQGGEALGESMVDDDIEQWGREVSLFA